MGGAADIIAKRSRASYPEPAFWVFNTQICILPHSRDSFLLSILTSSSTLKADKNSTLHCTSFNFRYFYVVTPFANFAFFNLHEKVMHLIFLLKEVCQVKKD